MTENKETIIDAQKLHVMQRKIYLLERDNAKSGKYTNNQMVQQIIRIVDEVYKSNI